jgi:hypothetical protein
VTTRKARSPLPIIWIGLMLVACTECPAVFLNYANPIDQDKSNDGMIPADDTWNKNWFDDQNHNGKWDVGEPWTAPPGGDSPVAPPYQNPVRSVDNSCWANVAANMLSAAGYGPSPAIVNTIFNGFMSWESLGSVAPALTWYVTGPGAGVSAYTIVKTYNPDGGGLFDGLQARDFIARELRTPDLVGIEIHPLIPQHIDHAITVWGDDLPANWKPGDAPATQIYVTDSDMDYVGDYPANDNIDWWSWANDGTGRNISYPLPPKPSNLANYSVGDVVTLGAVPEPSTVAVFLFGGVALIGWARRRRNA